MRRRIVKYARGAAMGVKVCDRLKVEGGEDGAQRGTEQANA